LVIRIGRGHGEVAQAPALTDATAAY
jgi:hypothetical protein